MPGSAKLSSGAAQLCAISGHGIVSGRQGSRQCTTYGPVDPWIEAIRSALSGSALSALICPTVSATVLEHPRAFGGLAGVVREHVAGEPVGRDAPAAGRRRTGDRTRCSGSWSAAPAATRAWVRRGVEQRRARPGRAVVFVGQHHDRQPRVGPQEARVLGGRVPSPSAPSARVIAANGCSNPQPDSPSGAMQPNTSSMSPL